MNKMIHALHIFLGRTTPVSHEETDKMVELAKKQTQATLKKIRKFNVKLERTQTYFIARAIGRIH